MAKKKRLHQRIKPFPNRHLGTCYRCGVALNPGEGEFVQAPLRLCCALCVMVDGITDNGFDRRLRELPDLGLSLMGFQETDARRISNTRALLVGHQMGCGKCRSYKDLAQINGELQTAEFTWNEYASPNIEFDGEGYWSEPTEPLFVNSIDDATGRIVRRPVKRLYRQRVREKLVRVRLNDGSETTITKAHKLRGPEVWTNEIRPGDRICVPARLLHESGDLDLELAELMGWLIGDGREESGRSVFTQKDRMVCERLAGILARLGFEPSINEPRATHLAFDLVSDPGLREFMLRFDYPWGTRSRDRRVPLPVMQGNAEVVRTFLRAYMDAEGSCPKRGSIVEFSSASQLLVKELVHLFRRFGIWVRVRSKRARATNSPNCPYRDYWVGTISGASLRRYRDEVGFSVGYKTEQLERACAKKVNSNTEGLPASDLIRAAFDRAGLPASWWHLDPKYKLSTVYLKGKQEFSRESLAVVVEAMDNMLSGQAAEEYLAGKYRRERIDEALRRLDYDDLRVTRDRAWRLIEQEVHYATVVSVEEVDYDDWVYDLEIERDHNYVAEGILCHNTVISSFGALRSDMPNLVFSPSSVRYNWQKEIKKWRPDLRPKMATSMKNYALKFKALSPGDVLLASFGVLPGEPCKGCKRLRGLLRYLRKERRIGNLILPRCEHTHIDFQHPRTFELVVDGRRRVIPYHYGGKYEEWVDDPDPVKICGHDKHGEPIDRTCHQANPYPEITGPMVLLADECHAFKNPSSFRTQRWRAMRDRVWAMNGFVYGLSGTPCEGKPSEFWEVLKSLGLERAAFGSWDNYFRIFRHWYENPKGSRRPPTAELRDELHARLRRVQINRRRKDVLSQLPPRVEKIIEVEINDKTRREVEEAVHHMLAVKRSWQDVTADSGPHKILSPFEPHLSPDERDRRRLIYDERVEYYFQERPWNKDEEILEAVQEALLSRTQMPTIDELSRIRSMLSQAKFAAVKAWIEECEEENEPVVLFSQHVSILKKLAGESYLDGRPGWDVFHGGVAAKKRQKIVEAFQSGEIERGLAVSIGAGGEGITLTRAKVAGFIDLSWNPAKNQQAESRLIRIGAEGHDSILIVRFVAKHVVDKLVLDTLREKESLLDSLEWDEEERI